MTTTEEVLLALRSNARLSSAQIAERLGVHESKVDAIIRDNEANNTIRGYYTLLNENAFERQVVRALIEVAIQPERDGGFDHVAKRIGKFSEVTDVLLVSGNSDLQLVVEGETLQDIANFVASKLAPLDGVQSTRTHFILKRYKEAGFQYEQDEDYERLKVTP